MTQSNSAFIKVMNTKPPKEAYKQATKGSHKTKEHAWTRTDKRLQES